MRVSPLMFIVLLVLVACTAEPQAPEGRTDLLLTDYAGDWEGTLNAGGQALPLVLHVDPEASPQVTMDSPAQGANGIPASEVSVEEGALLIAWDVLGARYAGRLSDDGDAIMGQFSQGPITLDLLFERGDGVVDEASLAAATDGPDRPQTPKPPFPYTVEELTLTMSDGTELAGSLILPDAAGPVPLVVLSSGTGAQDRDETLFGHKPLAVLADHLGRNGIASVRFDDRGIGGSSGDYFQTQLPRLADDVLEIMAALRSRSDFAQVGIIGHSEGGIYAGLAASRGGEAGPDFIVSLAGPFAPVEQTIMDQVERAQDLAGLPADAKAANIALQQQIMEAAQSAQTPDKACEAIRLVTEPSGTYEQARLLCDPIFFSLLRVDVASAYAGFEGPVLALFGELDRQVVPARHVPVAEEVLNDHARTQITIYPGANHLFQQAETGDLSEYGTIEQTMDPAVMDLITAFIAAATE